MHGTTQTQVPDKSGLLKWSLGGFLLIEHSCRYPLDRRNAKTYGHLGASCSNIGRIRTKENIAVNTQLIGIAKSYSNLRLTPLERFTDRIRIRGLWTLFIIYHKHKYLTILRPFWKHCEMAFDSSGLILITPGSKVPGKASYEPGRLSKGLQVCYCHYI